MKCKKKNCTNQVEEGKKYCKLHQAKREEKFKNLFALGSTVLVGGVGLLKKIKK